MILKNFSKQEYKLAAINHDSNIISIAIIDRCNLCK